MSETQLEAIALLHRVNAEIVRLRRALSHDHGDAAFWSAQDITAPAAQARRAKLRPIAHRLHVERAHARGRLHGRVFSSLAAQGEWLAAHERRVSL